MSATLLAALGVGACGKSDATSDAGVPDAEPELCTLAPGQSYVLSQIHIGTPDIGLDLDGDGNVDNMIGQMPDSARQSANDAFDNSIASGELDMLFHVTDWTDPPTDTDPDVSFDVFVGVDADSPYDPSNNLSGNGEFYVRLDQFDLNCMPAQRAESASITNRELVAKREDGWQFVLTINGAMEFTKATVIADLSPDFATGTGLLSAALTICSLDKLPFPGDLQGSVLDVFANESTFSVEPDIDLDGDGLEKVIGDGVSIAECIDGDGTVIPGADCVCSPKIADAYSMGAEIQLVKANIVGVR